MFRSASLLRGLVAAVLLSALAGGVDAADAGTSSTAAAAGCTPRVLVLSAMPVELSPLLASSRVSRTVTVDGHDFFVGRLRGHDVVLAMTGIGPVNGTATTRLALRKFRCGGRTAIGAAVFSGVAGGDYIGDVAVPGRWTSDDGTSWVSVDRTMLATARSLARARLPFERKTPAGDPLCTCVIDPATVSTVEVEHSPALKVGGDGQTSDPFGGRAIPCVPGDNDVFGCDPCPAAKHEARDLSSFPQGIAPFVDPGFFTGYLRSPATTSHDFAAQDEETAAVARVTASAHVPFLAFRAISDGGGDPLGLPGFPFQFFYYRQLASDNAAIATMAFLHAWHGA